MISRSIYSLFVSVLLLHLSASSQSIIEGRIVDKANKPVTEASVMLLTTADSSVVAYNFTNQNGEFSINTDKLKAPELLIMVYGFNIKRQTKKISNHSQKVNFVVSEEAIELKEFAVKSQKIWGSRDTINYIVDAFRDSSDIVIADVLRKMPGIEVKESGQIEYRGKAISKFYIENMDMLQGRYSIATNNISASDIATVQVLENHQPIKALQDMAFSDDPALNLKLKPDAKGIFSCMADLGAGFNDDFLWNGSVTGMFFSKLHQHLSAIKTNNTGVDLAQELQSLYGEEDQLSNSISYVMQPVPPRISKERYLFNQAFGGTINNLVKAKNEAEITLNFSGSHDIETRKSYDQTMYYFPGNDTISISEQMESRLSSYAYDGSVGYRLNGDQNYINSRLSFSGNRIENTGVIFNKEQINQRGENDPYKVSCLLSWIRRGNNENRFGTEFNSSSFYQSLPYNLEVSPGMFANTLNDSTPFQSVSQNVALKDFKTQNSLRFLSSAVWGSFRIHPSLHFSMEHQSLNTQMSKSLDGDIFSDIQGDSLRNDVTWMRLKAGLSLTLTYQSRNFRFELFTPLQYQSISLDDWPKAAEADQYRMTFQPQAKVSYAIGSHWQVIGSWFMYNYNPTLRNLYSSYVLQNYRTMSHYDSRLSDSYGQQGSLTLSYKDIIRFFFTNLEVRYSRYLNEVMYAQSFEGSLMKISSVDLENRGNYLSITARASKGFDWKKLSVNMEASWGKGLTPQLRQNNLINYRNQGVNGNITLSLAFTERLQFANKSSWSSVSGRIDDDEKLEPINSFIDAASVNYTFPNGIVFSLGFEYYDTHTGGTKQSFYLVDSGVSYTWKRVRVAVGYSNILNTKNYVYAYFDNLSSYYSEYRIRPSSILFSARFKIY